MKKTTLLLLTILTHYLAKAQLYIGANAGYNYTTMYNTSDAKADERQDYIKTFKPQFGIELGYAINNKVSIGIIPQSFKAGQKYTGTPNAQTYIDKITADVSLNYFKVPLYLQFNLGSQSKTPKYILRVGASYASLTSFKEINSSFYTPSWQNQFRESIVTTINNLEATSIAITKQNNVSSADTGSVKFERSIYNKTHIGVNIGFGYSFKVNSNINIYGLLNADYGLSNVENTDTIKILDPQTDLQISDYTSKYFKYCKYNKQLNSSQPNRSTNTNNIAIGLQIGLIYKFSKQSEPIKL